ncbi:MAG: DUF4386 domain-containing protein [Pseudomonadota bacterium]|nr:DUF4386 domain-containing protein [Pseudomonadota bacterium]
MTLRLSDGRLAGLLYLLLVLTGIFSLIYVPSQVTDMNDPERMLALIRDNRALFAAGICVGLTAYVIYLALPVVLYRILAPHGATAARLMVLFALASVPMTFLALGEKLALLDLAGTDGALAADAGAQALVRMETYFRYTNLASIFWGLWLFPLGWLGWRSGLLPHILGFLLMFSCIGFLIEFAGPLFMSGYSDSLLSTIAGTPSSFAEIGTCLWLLIMGEPKAWRRETA